MTVVRTALSLALTGLLASVARGQDPLLQLQGQPFFDGAMSLHLDNPATQAQPAMLLVGFVPLLDPIPTGKGPLHVGEIALLVPLGVLPAGARLDMAFTMPPEAPYLAGLTLALQGFSGGRLSNPATLPFSPAFLSQSEAMIVEPPVPEQGAAFGRFLDWGDLNGDGEQDLVTSAWFEDSGGVLNAGATYVFWGPDFTSSVRLQSPLPKSYGVFGGSLAVDDLDQDGIDDLVVAEASVDPPQAGDHGHLYVYFGGEVFVSTPALSLASAKDGLEAIGFGRVLATGDLNDDGWPDLAARCAYATVAGQTKAGAIEVFWGPGFLTSTLVVDPLPGKDEYFGQALAVGDVTGDGVADLVEGSGTQVIGGFDNVGRLHVFTGPSLDLGWWIDYPLAPAGKPRFGDVVYVADLGGDGIAEIVSKDENGHVFVFWSETAGGATTIHKPPSSQVNPFGETAFGDAFAAGDMNGDGIVDLVIGDSYEGDAPNCTIANSGMAFVALGPWLATFSRLHDVAPACGDQFAAGMAGCASRDGLSFDLAVPAYWADAAPPWGSGHVTIFKGGEP